jgi:uncharacterized membrane protein
MNNSDQDQAIEQTMGTLLRIGVIASALVVAMGGIVFLIQNGREPVDYQKFHQAAPELQTVGGTFHEALRFHGRALIQIGLWMLIATPIARVALSIFAFGKQRDWRYVAVTVFVLAVLLYSVVQGYADRAG